ncbi:MAG TPA: hypothetical protein DCM08_12785 [Microscillaceae bacterium]|nr:hypothetical protein [Microscillaceae bacterium]
MKSSSPVITLLKPGLHLLWVVLGLGFGLSACRDLNPIARPRQNLIVRISTGTAFQNSAIVSSTLRDIDPTDPIIEHGHCYSFNNPVPTVEDSTSRLGGRNSFGTFTSNLPALLPNTTYFIRPYVRAENELIYGEMFTIVTGEVKVLGGSNVTPTGFTLTGFTSTNVNGNLSEQGFCISTTNILPTIDDTRVRVNVTANRGIFNAIITGLTANTTYYCRAYLLTADGAVEYSAPTRVNTAN